MPTGVPHNEVEPQTEFNSFTAAHLGSNTNQHGLTSWRHMHKIQQVSLCPSFSTICAIAFIQVQRGWKGSLDFPEQDGGFSESYVVRISVQISRICEFRVNMGKITGLLGCPAPSGATIGFWLHHSHYSLGCWTNNTRADMSSSPNNTGYLAVTCKWNCLQMQRDKWTRTFYSKHLHCYSTTI